MEDDGNNIFNPRRAVSKDRFKEYIAFALIFLYVYRLNKTHDKSRTINCYLLRIIRGPVDGCVDKTASSVVVDEKTKERKENGLCDGNFPNGDDPSLIQSAAKMVLVGFSNRS